MSEDRIQLWIGLCFVGSFCAYCWYWYIRSIIFYYKNGFDYSVDFGPSMSSDDGDELSTPRQKFLLGWPFSVIVTSVLLVFVVLALIGVLKPCVDCG